MKEFGDFVDTGGSGAGGELGDRDGGGILYSYSVQGIAFWRV